VSDADKPRGERPRRPRRPRGTAPLRKSVLHVDARGRARMVDVGGKGRTRRVAVAHGALAMGAGAFEALAAGRLAKGDALAVARLAGIQAAKRTSEIVPLCHPLALESVEVDVALEPVRREAVVTATVRITGKTGVEMEALTAVAASCLALYDMVKALDRSAAIREIVLVEKSGGRSGTYRRRRVERLSQPPRVCISRWGSFFSSASGTRAARPRRARRSSAPRSARWDQVDVISARSSSTEAPSRSGFLRSNPFAA